MSQTADSESKGWRPYRALFPGPEHTVVGNLHIRRRFFSPALQSERDLVVYLPPGYTTSERRYPTVVMMDGQNMFDVVTAHSGEWHVDETMERLSREGLEAIIVAVPNGEAQRANEYSPFAIPGEGSSQAKQLLDYLVEWVLPEVAAHFRVSDQPAERFLFGSSLGALFALYALFERPDIFGGAGLMSPALWPGNYAIFPYLKTRLPADGRIYIDVGTRELSGRYSIFKLHYHSVRYYRAARKLYRHLAATEPAGKAKLRYLEVPGARHHDQEWSRRLPDALRFLLAPTKRVT